VNAGRQYPGLLQQAVGVVDALHASAHRMNNPRPMAKVTDVADVNGSDPTGTDTNQRAT
jgi:hypothetical protein